MDRSAEDAVQAAGHAPQPGADARETTMSEELAALFAVVRRDLLLAQRRRSDVVTTLVFFIIVVSLFPLGVGADRDLLRSIGPGVVWVAALLASLLSLSRLLSADYADGSLEQLRLSAHPLPLLVLGKVLAHWISIGVPLSVLAPLLGLQYDLPLQSLLILSVSLLLGTPALSFIGGVGEALTLGLPRAGALIALLVLPLDIPVLILGAGAVDASANGLGAGAHLSLLGAYLIAVTLAAPWTIALGLRISME
jgi:heme exporter protein B